MLLVSSTSTNEWPIRIHQQSDIDTVEETSGKFERAIGNNLPEMLQKMP